MANCSQLIPHARDLMARLSPVGLGLIISTGIATLITIAVFLSTAWVVREQVSNGLERYISLYLVGMYPVIAMTSFIGIISPRSVHIDDLVAAIYLSVSVAMFFRLMVVYHGGKEEMCRSLHGVRFPSWTARFRCCRCLPQADFNMKNVGRLQLMTYQIVVVRPVLLFMMAVIRSEEEVVTESLMDNPIKAIVTVLTVVSTVLALLALLTTFRLSAAPLKNHGIVPKFVALKLVLLFCDPQALILRMVATAGLIPCTDILDNPIQGDTLKFILLCYEMMLVAILARWMYGHKIRTQKEDLAVVEHNGHTSL